MNTNHDNLSSLIKTQGLIKLTTDKWLQDNKNIEELQKTIRAHITKQDRQNKSFNESITGIEQVLNTLYQENIKNILDYSNIDFQEYFTSEKFDALNEELKNKYAHSSHLLTQSKINLFSLFSSENIKNTFHLMENVNEMRQQLEKNLNKKDWRQKISDFREKFFNVKPDIVNKP